MNNKHKKKAKVAMTIALTATSIAHSTSNILAQGECTIEEHLPIDDTEEKVEAVGDVEINKKLFSDPEPNPGPDPEPFPNPAPDPDPNPGPEPNPDPDPVPAPDPNPSPNPNPDFGDRSISIDEINFPDPLFREYISINFDTDGNGVLSNDEINNITKIDLYSYSDYYRITDLSGIEHFPYLTYLNCSSTRIVNLDVSKNSALENLRCGNTSITSLDVSNNPALKYLDCYSTRITSLDVSNNPELRDLTCYVIRDLHGLDVSNNPNLTWLHISPNSFAWLNIGNKSSYTTITTNQSTIALGGIGDTFNIKERFPGIDISKIMNMKGAHLDPSTGVVSGYTLGTPITYTYDCDKVNIGNAVTLDVTMHFKGLSSITINDDLNKVYDGQAVINPTDIEKIGSTGDVRIEWYRADGIRLGIPPINAGSYKVKAILEEDTNYVGAEVEKEFEIKKDISTIIINDNLNKVYDGRSVAYPRDIEKTGSSGGVSLKWYTADGVELGNAPSEVGSYKVKAILAEDINYVGAEVEKEFDITKATSTIIIDDDLNKVYDGQPVTEPINVRTTGSKGGVSFKWYKADGVELGSAPSEVGSYKVKAILEGDASHDGIEVEKEFNITKATSMISIKDNLNKVYDGIAVTDPIDIEIIGSIGTVSFEWYTEGGVLLQGAPIEAGNYKVKAILIGDANHDGVEVEKSFTITKASSTIVIHDDLNKVYDGTAVVEPMNIKTTGSTGDVSFEWYMEDDTLLQGAPTEAGNYKVKAILASDTNYDSIAVEKSFTITKATSTITIHDDLNKVYDGVVVEPMNIETTGSTGPITYEWYKKEESTTRVVTWTKLAEAPSETGYYKVKAILIEDANHDSVEVEKSFAITKASSTITINDDLNKEYDGIAVLEPTDIIITGTTGYVSYEWYTADGTLLQGAPSEVGNYKLVVMVEEDTNHNGVVTEVKFSIRDAQSITPPIVEDSKEDVETNDKIESNESIGNQVNGVQTGDVTKVGLWTILVVLSIGVILFFIKKSRKEE